jgi:dTDP-4-dehydrorhamnose 3,5-epimerase
MGIARIFGREGGMKFSKRGVGDFEGAFVIRQSRFVDNRGFFFESWSRQEFAALELDIDFVQDNQSFSQKAGTIRGLHLQCPPFAQAKLVSVLSGAIYDVIVDLRRSSSSFGRWFGISLTAQEGEMLFVPRGFAHGFVTLKDETTVAYKVDAPYAKEFESGIRWNDPCLNISWPVDIGGATLSEKDSALPLYKDCLAVLAERSTPE